MPRILSLPEQIIAEWKASPALRAEFLDLAAFTAWKEHEHCKASGISLEELRNESPDVAGYLAAIEVRKGHLTAEERQVVETYAATWRASREIRAEFLTFEIYAAYLAGVESGRARICGRSGA